MSKIESFLVGCVLGGMPILFCFVTAWFLSAVLVDESLVPVIALSGLGVGIIIDVFFLKRWVKNAYRINNIALGVLYILCSVIGLGFGMGVPLLNFGVGIAAGIYTARKMHYTGADDTECNRNIKKAAIFSAVVMMLMCCLTGFWAFVGGMVGYRFESPILSFTYTATILAGVVLTGGLILCLLQYWITWKAGKIVSKLSKWH